MVQLLAELLILTALFYLPWTDIYNYLDDLINGD